MSTRDSSDSPPSFWSLVPQDLRSTPASPSSPPPLLPSFLPPLLPSSRPHRHNWRRLPQGALFLTPGQCRGRCSSNDHWNSSLSRMSHQSCNGSCSFRGLSLVTFDLGPGDVSTRARRDTVEEYGTSRVSSDGSPVRLTLTGSCLTSGICAFVAQTGTTGSVDRCDRSVPMSR